MNERQTLKNINGALTIGGVKASDLAKKYNTPLYVFDEDFISKMILTFKDSVSKFYGDGMISYASKAFCCKEIYRIVKNHGIGTDVVSLGELKTATSVSFPVEKVIFHGSNRRRSACKLHKE